MTEREWAYVAGIIDGEGSITIDRRGSGVGKPTKYRVSICVSNTDMRLLAWLKERVGGSIVPKAKPPVDKNWNQAFQIQWFGREAVALIDAVFPMLVIKRAQAEVAKEFYRTQDARLARKYSSFERDIFERLYLAIRQLNMRGPGRFADAERLSALGPCGVTRNIQ